MARDQADDQAHDEAHRPPDRDGPDADPEAVARAIVLRKLTGAPRSRAELEDILDRRGVPPAAAAAVLERFTELGLIDDAAYAELLVRSRRATRGLARRALGMELRRKGISDEVAAAALDTVDPDEEAASARALVTRRLPTTRGLDPRTRRRRLTAMLARKGYPPGLALRVVDEALRADGNVP